MEGLFGDGARRGERAAAGVVAGPLSGGADGTGGPAVLGPRNATPAECCGGWFPSGTRRALPFFLGQAAPEEAAVAQACEAAREQRAAECLAVLLEQRHRRFSAAAEKRFDL